MKVSEQAQKISLRYGLSAMHSICFIQHYGEFKCSECDRKEKCDAVYILEDGR